MATIILRQSNVVTSTGGTVKGSPLTNAEVDNNFANLNVAVNSVTYPVGSSGNVLTSNGTVWASQGLPASGLSYVSKSANYTLQNNEGVLSNTALGAFTITLPASPSAGNQVVVADSNGSWSSNNLTIARNGSTIENLAENLICDISGASLQLVYTGGTWDVFASTGLTGGTGVTLDGLETLTNKTLTSPTINTPTIASATLTGTTQAITAANGTSNAMVATTQFVNNEIRDTPTLNNATLTGTPQAVTAANATSNSMVATTAFVLNNSFGSATSATFTAPQRGTVTTDNDGVFDMNVTNNFKCTPAGTITLTFNNVTSGQSGYLLLVNNLNYTVAAAANTKVATGVLTTLSSNGTYLTTYFSDGANVFLTASGALA